MIKKILIVIAVVALIVFLANQRKKNTENIETVKPKNIDISQTVSASGKVKSDEEVNLNFQTGGKLAWVGVKGGDTVKKWQAIASLDQRALQKNLETYLNNYSIERTEFDDDQKTYEVVLTDFIKRIRQRSQYNLNNSVLAVELQDLTLKLSNISSPIAGVVTRADAQVAGVNIIPTTTWTISNPEKMIFEAEIDESDITSVTPGQKVKVTLDAMPQNPIEAAIDSISYTSHLTTSGATAYDAKIKLPENLNLRFGLNGEALIEVANKASALSIPNEAIYEKGNKKFVIILKGINPEEKEIQTGIISDNDSEIKSGLSPEDNVVIVGIDLLKKQLEKVKK